MATDDVGQRRGDDRPPPPACNCNVFDNTGKVIAWRSWACPLHKPDGWVARHGRSGEGWHGGD